MMTVAIQGGPFSWSHLAARQWLGEAVAVRHRRCFETALADYQAGRSEALLLPWWNSCIGAIPGVAALVREAGLAMHAEVSLAIEHCLVGLSGASIAGPGVVYSHPAALAQCRGFLKRHPQLLAAETHDTADSIQWVGSGRFAIASAEAAGFYGMGIVDRGIQDLADNRTVFWGFGGR